MAITNTTSCFFLPFLPQARRRALLLAAPTLLRRVHGFRPKRRQAAALAKI